MKVSIGEDERYPDYFFNVGEGDPRRKEVNVRKDKLKRWEKIVRDYEKLQNELSKLFNKE